MNRHARVNVIALLCAALLSLATPTAWAQDTEDSAAVPELSKWEQVQSKANDAFGAINAKLAPVLFVDVSFGMFDPTLAEAEAHLSAAQTQAVEAAAKLSAEDSAHLEGLLDDNVALPEDQALRQRLRPAIAALDQVQALTEIRDKIARAPIAAEELGPAQESYLTAKRDLDKTRAELSAAQTETAETNLAELQDKVTSLKAEANVTIYQVPLIVLVLLLGGVFFTLRFGFINLRLFGHAIQVLRGKYDNPKDHGEVTHFQALTAALSATVGLGNIAGVALAISLGGPGAVLWMWLVAVFGMSAKFSSCTLAQAYRKIEPEDGKVSREHVLGGPMLYLSEGMKEMLGKGLGTPFGKVLAIMFAFFAIGGALGGGNMFQSNQTAEIVAFVALDGDKSYAWVVGVVMAVLVALVIVGGIRRIGEVTSKIVPAMCGFYCLVCLIILATNAAAVPAIFTDIFRSAFSTQAAGWGGLMGILVIGVKRGAFSNEAGLGSAAIAHSAAKTDEPVREGTVAMLGPFIDTIVVCTMTALTILVTQDRLDPAALEGMGSTVKGAALTAQAFGTLHGFMPFMLCIAVFVFAYSTMISWGYYGERATEYLFGKGGIWPYRVVFLSFVVMGPMLTIGNVLDFTDLLILSMAYPNIIGMVILSPKVAKMAKDYVRRLKSGEMKTYAAELEEEQGQPSI